MVSAVRCPFSLVPAALVALCLLGYCESTALRSPIPPEQLQAELQAAADAGKPGYTVQAGDYHFGSSSLVLKGAKDFAIDAKGATFWFTVGGGMQLQAATNTTVNDLIIDYEPTYAQGRVVSCCGNDGMSFEADLDTTMQLPLSEKDKSWFLEGAKVAFWSGESRTMWRNESIAEAINIFPSKYEVLSDVTHGIQRYRITVRQRIGLLVPVPLPKESLVTIFPRGGKHSLFLGDVTRCRFNHLQIYGGSSMGIVEDSGGGDNKFYKLNITRRPLPNGGADRLLAINADGFHSVANTVGPTIQHSEISFTGDDLTNFGSPFFVLLRVVNSTTVTVVDHGSNQFMKTFAQYDTLSFFNLNSMEHQGDGIRMTHAQLANDKEAETLLANARDTLAKHGTKFQDWAWNGAKAIDVSLDSVPPGVKALQTTVTHDQNTDANTKLLDSYIHDGYARLLMLYCRNSQVLRNKFARSGGVHVSIEQNWLEGDPGITNVSISDNTLEGCGGAQSIVVDDTVHGIVDKENNTIIASVSVLLV